MQKIISAAGMREIDRLTTEQYAIPSLLLMESAAEAAYKAITTHLSQKLSNTKALILCGRGNNGGDGASLARKLWTRGLQVDVVLFGHVAETKGDAGTNFEIVRRLSSVETNDDSSRLSFVECDSIAAWEDLIKTGPRNYDVIIDALFGTGLTRPLEGVFQNVVEHLNSLREARERANMSRPLFVSIDIPSGLNADLARPIGVSVHADLTVTFTAPKPANVLPPAAQFGGKLIVANIGSPPSLIDASASQLFLTEKSDARVWLEKTRYTPDSYKNSHGHALIIAGSRCMTGAAVLCGEAAMRSGAGLVTVATPASAMPAIAARIMPEIMTAELAETANGAVSIEAIEQAMKLAERATIIAIGPGLSSADEQTRAFVRAVVERRVCPVVIDADGLNALSPWSEDLRGSKEAPLILTPHEGEMRRLINAKDQSALQNRVQTLRDFAVKHSLLVVLKGTRTLIAAPDGRVFVNPTGNAGLGTAGSGDTLTGIITGFNAQEFGTFKERADALSATLAAVFIGGLAGGIAARNLGMRTMVASDIREHLSHAIRELDPQGEAP